MHHIGSSALQLLYIYFIHYLKVNINFLFRIVSLTILPIISTCFINKLCAKLIIHRSQVIQDNISWKKVLELGNVLHVLAQSTISHPSAPFCFAFSHSFKNVLNASSTYLTASETHMFSINLSGYILFLWSPLRVAAISINSSWNSLNLASSLAAASRSLIGSDSFYAQWTLK